MTCRRCVNARRERMERASDPKTTKKAVARKAPFAITSTAGEPDKTKLELIVQTIVLLGPLGFLCSICVCSGLMCSHLGETTTPSASPYSVAHDKAEEMRDKGLDGTDSDLSRMYDRAKDIDDARRFRKERLGSD